MNPQNSSLERTEKNIQTRMNKSVALKVRTEYTFGKVYGPVDRVVQRLKELGTTHAGVVDFNSTWGHVAWDKECRKQGIKPLFGIETFVQTPDGPCKMWMVAYDPIGLSWIYRTVSASYQNMIDTRQGKMPCALLTEYPPTVDIFAGDCLNKDFLDGISALMDSSPESDLINAKKDEMNFLYDAVKVSDNSYVYEEDRALYELMPYAWLKPTPQHILAPMEKDAHGFDALYSLASSDDPVRSSLPRSPMIKVEGDLAALCREGMRRRGFTYADRYGTRMDYELKVIEEKDFGSYFLIVADMVRFAKRHMLVGPSRGSAAGSLVCCVLGITEVDPVANNLMFERFIDVSRVDLPDIDLDFPDSKRHLIFDYMREKYGHDRTAHIGTISRFGARGALNQVCRKFNIPLSSAAPFKAVLDGYLSLDSAFASKEGVAFLALYPHARLAVKLEGHAATHGVHAAGLLVCTDNITNYCVVDDKGIAHVDKDSAEALGLLKIDVLGLRTLSIIEDCDIEGHDWYGMKLDDPKVFELFNTGRLRGIFQFEGSAMQRTCKRVKVRSLHDVEMITALSRPGPLQAGVTEDWIKRHDADESPKIHPTVDRILSGAYGLPVFQEQTLALVREVGGFNWEQTSKVRKAISKTQVIEPKYRALFIAGAVQRGVDERHAAAVWARIEAMGAWQMNRAHTHSYAIISYWTAWLKVYHPLAFYRSSLEHAKDDLGALALLREAVASGIQYVPFDIEKSQLRWSIHDGVLYGGFANLAGIGEAKGQEMLKARDAGELTSKQKACIAKASNPFANLSSIFKDHASEYASGRACRLEDIAEGIPHAHERVFIGELTRKALRDINDEANLVKRNGERKDGPFEYVDLQFRDDTEEIYGRISQWDFPRIGKDLMDNVPLGARLLIRAKFLHGVRYAYVSKWRVLG